EQLCDALNKMRFLGSLKGARVLVTGASTGIGEQMAYRYARFGAQIVITARREHILHRVAEKCVSLGAQKVLYIAADLAQPSDPDRVKRQALEGSLLPSFVFAGGLDYLVLNHIGASPFATWDGDVEHTRWLMQVNFLSYLQMTSRALPSLEESRGSIVVVSSLLGKMSSPFVGPYAATKFALSGFFGSLRHEMTMRGSNVTITMCFLGLIDTQSAMEKVKGYTNTKAHPASEAALHIIKAGATRQWDTFYPWHLYYMILTGNLHPFIWDFIIRSVYSN
uniref:Hydroxysteroid (11-beta) dehydrogenase 1-like a n=1 Tax=Scleropages formosus TaxID=113540 RepID=A0A8C9T1C3_SCLFO